MMKAKERFHNFVGEPANHPKVLEKSTSRDEQFVQFGETSFPDLYHPSPCVIINLVMRMTSPPGTINEEVSKPSRSCWHIPRNRNNPHSRELGKIHNHGTEMRG